MKTRNLLTTALLYLTFIAIVSISFAQSNIEAATSLVMGQNNPDLDIQAVQNAVNHGGTVQLQGTFNFGEDGSVLLQKDVTVLGIGHSTKLEGDFAQLPATKILGGNIPFLNKDQRVSVTIQNIWFEGPKSMAIALTAASGDTKLTGNRITDVKEGLHPATDRPTAGGILLSNHVRYAGGEGYAYEPMPDPFDEVRDLSFTGKALVENNYIDLDPEGLNHYDYLRAVGIESTQTTAQTTIRGNIIKNSSHAGILVTDNFARHIISDNIVRIHDYPDGKKVLFPTGSSFGAEGIVIVEVFFEATDSSASLITNNTIETGGSAHAEQTGGEGPAALGIMINGPHLVEGNHVTMDGGYAAVLIWTRPQAYFDERFPGFIPPSSASDSIMARNSFEGKAEFLYTAKNRRDIPFDSQGEGSSNRATNNTFMLAKGEADHFIAQSSNDCILFLSRAMEHNTIVINKDVPYKLCDSGANNKIVR